MCLSTGRGFSPRPSTIAGGGGSSSVRLIGRPFEQNPTGHFLDPNPTPLLHLTQIKQGRTSAWGG